MTNTLKNMVDEAAKEYGWMRNEIFNNVFSI